MKDWNDAYRAGVNILDIADKARAERPKADSSEPRFKLVPFNEIRIEMERRDLIKGLIPRVGIIVVWGPPKCGKTFWASDAMLHVALGWEYRARKVQRGAVVYCSFEGHGGLARRVEAFRQFFLQEHTGPIPFYVVRAALNLVKDHAQLLADIREQLGDTIPVAVVLDTLNRSLGGSESSDDDMSAYLRAADAIRSAFECAVIIVHHCGVSGDRPRGHTSLTGTADAQLSVSRDANDNIVVKVEFMKDGAEDDVITSQLEVVEVGLDEDGDTITSCVVVPAEPITIQKRKVTGAAKIALDLLKRAMSDEGQTPPAINHVPGNVQVVRESLWRRYCYEGTITETDNPDTKQKAFARASRRLQSLDLVGKWGEWVWLI